MPGDIKNAQTSSNAKNIISKSLINSKGQEYDDLASLMATYFDVPIATICFYGDDSVLYKAATGTDITQTSIRKSPLLEGSRKDDIMVLNDIKADPEKQYFRDTSLSDVVFYATAPVIASDMSVPVGAIEIMDFKKRDFSAKDNTALKMFSNQLKNLVELNREHSETEIPASETFNLGTSSAKELKTIQKLINRIPDIICIKDRRGRYLMDNEAHRKFLGVKKSKFIKGKTVSDFLPQEIAEKHNQNDNEVLTSGQPLISETEPVVDSLGRESTVCSSRIPLHDEAGNIDGLLCIEREEGQGNCGAEALAHERYLLNSLMNNIADHIYFKDRQSRFIRINKAMASWFNLESTEEAVGKTDFDFFTHEHAQQAYDDEQWVMETGKTIVGKEEKETWPDGSVTWASSTKEPLYDQNCEIIGCFGISRDISHTKEISIELAERDQRIREELKLARSIHDAMLPTEAPDMKGLEFGMKFVPSGDIGGDFLDFIPLDNNHKLGIVFADITGHGIAAALLSAMLKVMVEEVTPKSNSQSECFNLLNQRLHDAYPAGNFASTFYAVVDAEERTISYVKASQEPVILIREGEEPQILTEGGPALGLLGADFLGENEYCEHSFNLQKGDTLFFFTDGLLEYIKPQATTAIPYSKLIEWLQEYLHLSPQEMVDKVYQRATEYAEVSVPTDDAAALAIRVTE